MSARADRKTRTIRKLVRALEFVRGIDAINQDSVALTTVDEAIEAGKKFCNGDQNGSKPEAPAPTTR